jgi:hypothetical protein
VLFLSMDVVDHISKGVTAVKDVSPVRYIRRFEVEDLVDCMYLFDYHVGLSQPCAEPSISFGIDRN